MTDILFINPLGWDRCIWARVLENMPDQTFDFIEFTEESFKSISKKEIVLLTARSFCLTV